LSEVLVRRIVLSAVIVALGSTGLIAQQSRLTFEVASVKPQKAPPLVPELAGRLLRVLPGGILNVSSITVESLIEFAYNLRNYQIVGGPDWIRRDGFEVNARAPMPDATTDEARLMVRALLEDRFGLTARMDERDMRHHALVLSRSPDQLGPYLRHFAKEDCTPEVAKSARAAFSRQTPQGARVEGATCGEMWLLERIASRESDLPVIDATGLTGRVVFDLHYRSSGVATGPASASDPSLALFADAIEEQLGLKLEQRRGPVTVLVIESVQQPTEN
jgi:uncharacterized protein (TIGR03435 family)